MQGVARRDNLDLKGQDFYGEVLETLKHARVPILIGGGYALAWHTSIHRQTKDLDIFLRRKDCAPAFAVLAQAGFRTEIVFKHWLGKVRSGDDFIDIIFNSGNGLAEVTDAWFERGVDAEILGRAVQLCAPEEMIWSKAFVMERERYDGADIAHLLRVKGASPGRACSSTLVNTGACCSTISSSMITSTLTSRARFPPR